MGASDLDAGAVLSAEPPSFDEDDAARIAREVFGVEGAAFGIAERARPELPHRARRRRGVGAQGLEHRRGSGRPRHGEQGDGPCRPRRAVAARACDPADVGRRGDRARRRPPGAPRANSCRGRSWTSRRSTIGSCGSSARRSRGSGGRCAGSSTRRRDGCSSGIRSTRRSCGRCSSSIPPGEERDLVQRTLARWEAEVAPRFGSLRAQVVHGDLSLDNTLFAPDGTVSGVIDFGDMSHTALLCDLGVGLVSTMAGRADALRAGAVVVAGYETVTPLEPLERELPAVVRRDATGDEPRDRRLARRDVSGERGVHHPRLASLPHVADRARRARRRGGRGGVGRELPCRASAPTSWSRGGDGPSGLRCRR